MSQPTGFVVCRWLDGSVIRRFKTRNEAVSFAFQYRKIQAIRGVLYNTDRDVYVAIDD